MYRHIIYYFLLAYSSLHALNYDTSHDFSDIGLLNLFHRKYFDLYGKPYLLSYTLKGMENKKQLLMNVLKANIAEREK